MARALANNRALQDLNLRYNRITWLPVLQLAACLRLHEIKRLNFSGNPGLRFPPNAGDSDALLRFLRDLRDTGIGRPVSVAAAVVGHGAAGKTTLCQRVLLPEDEGNVGPPLPRHLHEWSSAHVQHWARGQGLGEGVVQALEAAEVRGEDMCSADQPFKPSTDKLEKVLEDGGFAGALGPVRSRFRALCRELEAARCEQRDPYLSTRGVCQSVRPLDGDGLELRVLDFAGQLEFYASHGLLLSNVRAVYVVVVRLTDRVSGRARPVGEVTASARHWLEFLGHMVGVGSRLPVLLVCSRADALPSPVRPEVTDALGALARKVGEDRRRLSVHGPMVVDYRDASSALAVRGRVDELAAAEAADTPVPAPFAAAEAALLAKAGDSNDVSQLLLRPERALEIVRQARPMLAGSAGLAERCLQHLHAMGAVHRSRSRVVVQPMVWFAPVLGQLVADTEANQSGLLEELELLDDSSPPEGRPLSWLHPRTRPRRVSVPGFVGVEALRACWRLLGCGGPADVDGVLELLVGVEQCVIVRGRDVASGWRELGEEAKASPADDDEVVGAWFPLLLPQVDESAESVDAFWSAAVSDDEEVVGRRVSADKEGGWLPASLFPSLVVRVLRRWPGARRWMSRRHLRLEMAGDGADKVQLLEVMGRATGGVDTRIDVLGRGPDGYERAVRPVFEDDLVLGVLDDVHGFTGRLLALCNVCLRQRPLSSSGRAVCGVALKIEQKRYADPRTVKLATTPWPSDLCCVSGPTMSEDEVMMGLPRAVRQLHGPHLDLTRDLRTDAVLRALPPPSAESKAPDVRKRVFVSHTWCDTHELAKACAAQLAEKGIPTFLDEKTDAIRPGHALSDGLKHGLYGCDLLVLFISPKVNDSKWCKLEVLTALKRKIVLLPVWYNMDPGDTPAVLKRTSGVNAGRHPHKYRGDEETAGERKAHEALLEDVVRRVTAALGVDDVIAAASATRTRRWWGRWCCA